ncbi:hypothetical protein EG328_001958 [Venturia inaequalis]|uniref:Uncharacterized protein n=1 Tax=Venturia inaequalis TaxID=5025 RepID=A0A8H3UWE4_VENIN|nr:hypothetical protein EG328_001958 [Venturia inaequalis]KAE9990870.1 hypothetical protein EG327_000804 [Venturia inaequalis]
MRPLLVRSSSLDHWCADLTPEHLAPHARGPSPSSSPAFSQKSGDAGDVLNPKTMRVTTFSHASPTAEGRRHTETSPYLYTTKCSTKSFDGYCEMGQLQACDGPLDRPSMALPLSATGTLHLAADSLTCFLMVMQAKA